MRIGLALPHYDYSFPDHQPLTWPRLLESAQRAEALGFDSVWISDHFFANLARYGGPDEPVGTVEPFAALAALATATKRVRLGTLVACAPFRHVAHVAKMATSIDLFSGGRFDLGIGAGWYEKEFEAFGYEFGAAGDRFSKLEESVEALALLFRDDPVTFDGDHVHLDSAYNRPLPVQPGGPPIWVGGKGGDRLLKLVARHAAGWNTVWRWSVPALAERIEALRQICEHEGRDPGTARVSVGLYTLLGEDERDLDARFRALQRWTPGGALDGASVGEYAKDTLTGTPERCLEELAELSALGVEELIVSAASLPFAINDWSEVELIAASLIPQAARL
jgi:probable F420-dependent oxidoreductase